MWKSELRQNDAVLVLILALAVRIADLTGLIGLEEENLAESLVGIHASRKRGRIGDLEGYKSLPLGLERRHVDDDAAARVGRLPYADREDVARDLEVLNRTRQREGVGRHDHAVGLNRQEGALIEIFRVDD